MVCRDAIKNIYNLLAPTKVTEVTVGIVALGSSTDEFSFDNVTLLILA